MFVITNSGSLHDRLKNLKQKLESCSDEELRPIAEELLVLAEDSIEKLEETQEGFKNFL